VQPTADAIMAIAGNDTSSADFIFRDSSLVVVCSRCNRHAENPAEIPNSMLSYTIDIAGYFRHLERCAIADSGNASSTVVGSGIARSAPRLNRSAGRYGHQDLVMDSHAYRQSSRRAEEV